MTRCCTRTQPVLASVACLVLAAGLAHAADLNVPAQFPTIQAAINAANTGDNVLVAPGTYLEQIDFLGKAITVRSTSGAATTTISSGGPTPVVQFASGETALSRLEGFTITGGVVAGNGAGILIENAAPTVADCVVLNNQATEGFGGGVLVSGGTPSFLRVRFQGNLATSAGGVGGGGGAAVLAGNASFTDCLFVSNTANTVPGGALYIAPSAAAALTRGRFETNSAVSASGGAVYTETASLQVSGTAFDRNSAQDGAGGAIYALDPELLSVSNALFTQNTSTNAGGGGIAVSGGSLLVLDSQFTANLADGGLGGGIDADLNDATVRRTTFTNNETRGGEGGGISSARGSLLLEDSTFTGNFADGGSGGGLSSQNPAGTTISNTAFNANYAPGGSGGAADFGAGTFTITGSSFTGNYTPGGTAGALLFRLTASGSIRSSTIVGNGFEPGGPATSVGAMRLENTANVLLVNSIARNNSGAGGAFQVVRGGTLTIANSTLVDNTPDPGNITANVSNSTVGSTATIRVVNSIVRGRIDGNRRMLAQGGTASVLSATFSNIEGGFVGAGNINANPLFVNPGAADFRLSPGSPSIDTGSNAGVPAGITTDFAGNARIVGAAVDMGAYELQGACPGSGPSACGPGDWNEDGVIDFNDLLAFLNDYNAQTPCSDTNADGAVDFNDLLEYLNRYNTPC